MEKQKAEKIFIGGFYSMDVADNAPDFILGKGSIHIEKMQEWLKENKNLADEGGYVRYVIKKSQSTGKRYAEVDTWKPEKKDAQVKQVQTESTYDQDYSTPQTEEVFEVNPDMIPFK